MLGVDTAWETEHPWMAPALRLVEAGPAGEDEIGPPEQCLLPIGQRRRVAADRDRHLGRAPGGVDADRGARHVCVNRRPVRLLDLKQFHPDDPDTPI